MAADSEEAATEGDVEQWNRLSRERQQQYHLFRSEGEWKMKQQSVGLMQAKEKEATISPVPADDFQKCRQQIVDLVARRAYEIFESRGRSHGRDSEDWFQAESERLRPVHVELSDAGNVYIAVAAVTGYPPERLKICAEPRRLWICGLSPAADARSNGSEEKTIGSGPFLRSFGLPADIDTSRVSAAMRSDLLEVRMPKISRR
jgi:HSP20 family molecular chaperone IbpA